MALETLWHLAHDLVLLPKRTVKSAYRMVSPRYMLQWKANWFVTRYLSKKRLRELMSVPGTSSERECVLLAHLVGISPIGGCVVEIGAYKGKSTTMLIEAAQQRIDKPTVVSIDPHLRNSWEEFRRTCERFDLDKRGLEAHRCYSHDLGKTWNRPISFLWVDGGHEYDDVRQDIADFTPHVLPGGWVAFDDAENGEFPGVELAIAEWAGRPNGFRHITTIKNFQIFKREV